MKKENYTPLEKKGNKKFLFLLVGIPTPDRNCLELIEPLSIYC